MIRVVFVCLGNICRSPMAKGLFEAKVRDRGLADRFEIDSAGTSSYHVGDRPDPGSIEVAQRVGVDLRDDRSRQVTKRDLETFDYVIAMDRKNHRDLVRLGSQWKGKIHLMRSFEEGATDMDTPDPWGGGIGAFERMHDIVDRACEGLLDHILSASGSE